MGKSKIWWKTFTYNMFFHFYIEKTETILVEYSQNNDKLKFAILNDTKKHIVEMRVNKQNKKRITVKCYNCILQLGVSPEKFKR